MNRTTKRLLSLILVFCFVFGCVANVTAASSNIKVTINSVSVKVNNKPFKIDSFEYSGHYYVQPQDICSSLGIEYTYTAKSKSVVINDKKPVKPVTAAKPLFAAVKASTSKAISVQANTLKIMINGKAVVVPNVVYSKAVYVSAKSLSIALNRDFVIDLKAKTITVNEKKPINPIIKLSTAAVTDQDVMVTIDNWGNATVKEYRINNGTWQKYAAPFAMAKNGTIEARGKNVIGVESDTVSLKVENIRKLLSNVEVAENNSTVVKIHENSITGLPVASGSGIIISPDGIVVTNYHVLDLIMNLEVETITNKRYKVKSVLAYSVDKDLALLQLDTTDVLPYAKLGDSSTIKVGESVIAIGYPLGLQNTVTTGNISSLSPASTDLRKSTFNDILITTPSSPGSSGGALFNMYGEVVGIVYAGRPEAQNMNYAIPVNDLKPMLGAYIPMTPAEVFKAVYPSPDYKQFGDYLYYAYSQHLINGTTFACNGVGLENSTEKYNTTNIFIPQYYDNWKKLKEAVNAGKKADVEAWMNSILEEVKTAYPQKNYCIYLYLYDELTTNPAGELPSDQIEYDSATGRYKVFSLTLFYEYTNGAPTITWY